AEDGIRDRTVTGVQTCALPILYNLSLSHEASRMGEATGTRLQDGVSLVPGGDSACALEAVAHGDDPRRAGAVGREARCARRGASGPACPSRLGVHRSGCNRQAGRLSMKGLRKSAGIRAGMVVAFAIDRKSTGLNSSHRTISY